jgi:hypothetical protein
MVRFKVSFYVDKLFRKELSEDELKLEVNQFERDFLDFVKENVGNEVEGDEFVDNYSIREVEVCDNAVNRGLCSIKEEAESALIFMNEYAVDSIDWDTHLEETILSIEGDIESLRKLLP